MKKNKATAAMSALPALFFVNYIPNGAIIIVIALGVVILGLLGYIGYLYLQGNKKNQK